MPLTPADIHNMAFKKPPLGKRGYDEEEVDAFLDEAEQQMIRLLEENESLRGHLHHGGGAGPGPAAPSSGAAMSAEHAALAAQLDRAQQERARAEQQARGLQSQLEQASHAPPAPVDRSDRTAAVMMMAQRTADDHLEDARRESESLLAAARDKSVQITAEAQAKAQSTEGDARRNHTEAMNSLVAKRAALLDEIDRLSQLAAGYQEALNHHIAQQLQDMEGVQEPTGVGAG